MTSENQPRHFELSNLLTNVGDVLTTHDGHFYVDELRCACGEDDGIRYLPTWSQEPDWWNCNLCGGEYRFGEGLPLPSSP